MSILLTPVTFWRSSQGITVISSTYTSGAIVQWSCPTLLANDVLIFCYSDDAPSGGFTGVESDGGAGLTITAIGSQARADVASGLWWARAAGGEVAGSTLEIFNAGDSPSVANGVMFHLRGCKTSGNPYEGYSGNNGNSANSGPTPTTVTTVSNDLGLRFYCRSGTTLSSPPAGWTEEKEGSNATGGRFGITMACDSKLIASATTEVATTRTVAGAAAWNTHALAMIPA